MQEIVIVFSDNSPRPQPLLQPDICDRRSENRHEGDNVCSSLQILNYHSIYCLSGYLRGAGSNGPGQALRLCRNGQGHHHIEGAAG